ncbi:MAG: YtxH domain-containing protein [Anaerolineae bacterium]|nr:YtxH domain-containing protein [Anaerolineae bacterium]
MTNDRIYYSREAERVARRNQVVTVLLFMALGLGIGAVIAILFAPDEGDKTRKLIAQAVEDGYKRGMETAGDTLSKLEPEFPDVRKRFNDLIGSIRK